MEEKKPKKKPVKSSAESVAKKKSKTVSSTDKKKLKVQKDQESPLKPVRKKQKEKPAIEPEQIIIPEPEENTDILSKQDVPVTAEPFSDNLEIPIPEPEIKSVEKNYSSLGKEELYKSLIDLIQTKSINEVRNDIEAIRIVFYKNLKAEGEQKRKKFIEEGGNPEEFKIDEDPYEEKIRELLKKYRDLRTEHTKIHEDEKLKNLRLKYEIIDEIKELINSEESINKTFHDFRELQNRWREIGTVPQANLNDLWETYHHHIEKFYDYIKINKELRDLDLKKNMELKIQICEKAEALILEPNVINAFNYLQKFHEQWREVGPVPKEKRTEIWNRFKEATAKINKKHQQHYQDLKETQKKNLESKILLCEKVENINSENSEQHKDWISKTNEILELQKVWKTIGFAPKKENNKVYARFRSACDTFFEKKREYYAQTLEVQANNLQMKLDLCMQAESLKNNTDWKKTSEDFIKLQKKWKQIGPVSRKQSDAVWKRFRSACDSFFQKKSEYFSTIDNTYESNLKAKENLIKETQEFVKSDNVDQDLVKLQEFQRRWSEIGFVPFNKKEEIQERFREIINLHYDSLEMDFLSKNILKFRNRIESILQKPKPEIKLRFEREKYMNKLQQIKNDIGVWENNIGFFSNTKNASSMIKGFEEKIEEAKLTIRTLEEKITIIDELDMDL